MATLNKIMLMGRLTRDPETTTTQNGTRIAKFGIAVGRSKKNAQTGQWENDPNPLFIDCEAFAGHDAKRNLPGLIQQYLKKGDPLYLEGRLQLDQWDDKQTGQKRSKHKVVVDNIEFLGGAQGGGTGNNAGASRPAQGGNRAPANHGGDDYGGTPTYDDPAAGGSDIPF